MSEKIKIKVTEQSYTKLDKNGTSDAHLLIEGDDINYVMMNTIRRVSLSNIPIYAIDSNSIDIKGTSVYNNDIMKCRLTLLKIINIENNRGTLDMTNDIEHFNSTSYKEIVDDRFYGPLTIYCNVKNNTNDIMNVLTDKCEYYVDGNKIDFKDIYPISILLCKLKPDEFITFSLKTKIGIGKIHACWNCAHTYYSYDPDNPHKFSLSVESLSQLDAYEILFRSCVYIVNKLKNMNEFFSNYEFPSNTQGSIILKNEDHTFGNLFTYGLQDNPNITFAGYKQDHPLIRDITINYLTNGKMTINNIIKEVINKQIDIYDHLSSKFNKK
jgi:DNA-directed RNA polymerase subunit L/DNA-directed RNA polymerase alpha subunit